MALRGVLRLRSQTMDGKPRTTAKSSGIAAVYDDAADDDCSSSDSDVEDKDFERWRKELDRPKLPQPKLDLSLKPPLPLIKFKGVGVRSEEVKTITGQTIRSIASNLSPSGGGSGGDPLQDISHAQKLIKWFTARGNKEAAVRQPKAYLRLMLIEDSEAGCIADKLVYKNTMFDGNGNDDVLVGGDLLSRSSSASALSDPDRATGCLEFDSKFESGNLFKAVRVLGRQRLVVPGRVLESLQASPGGFAPPPDVDHEYDLTLRNDLNTNGNIQW